MAKDISERPQRRRRDAVYSESTSALWRPTSKRDVTTIEGLPEKWGIQAPHGAPQPEGLAPGRWAPVMPGYENQQGLCLGEMEGCGKPRLSPTNSLSPSSSTEVTAWKAFGSYKKIPWLILGWVPEGQGSSGTFPGDISPGECHFFVLSFHLVDLAVAGTISVTLSQPT